MGVRGSRVDVRPAALPVAEMLVARMRLRRRHARCAPSRTMERFSDAGGGEDERHYQGDLGRERERNSLHLWRGGYRRRTHRVAPSRRSPGLTVLFSVAAR
jgi:hypothetical protein